MAQFFKSKLRYSFLVSVLFLHFVSSTVLVSTNKSVKRNLCHVSYLNISNFRNTDFSLSVRTEIHSKGRDGRHVETYLGVERLRVKVVEVLPLVLRDTKYPNSTSNFFIIYIW